MPMIERRMHCSRRLLLYAIYDVLDSLQSGYEQREEGALYARLSVFDNVSGFLICAVQAGEAAAMLRISMAEPAPALTEEGIWRAMNFLADSIEQHLENEGAIKKQEE